MNTEQLKKHLMLIESVISEDRDPEINYIDSKGKVTANLAGRDSAKFSVLARKIEQIKILDAHIKKLKDDVKSGAREDVAALFDAVDSVHTRVVQTVSFIITLSKDPESKPTPKYKEILEELSKQLTPELLTVLEGLKSTMVSAAADRAPSITAQRIKESKCVACESGDCYTHSLMESAGKFSRLLAAVKKWSRAYDQKLNSLKMELMNR